MDDRDRATLRLMRLARDRSSMTEAERGDQHATMADARTALSLACGVDPAHIDGLGYERTAASYGSSRRSWVGHIAGHGWSEWYDRPHLEAVLADWAAHLPGLAEDPAVWLAEGRARHLATWPANCGRASCDLHGPPVV